MHQPVLSVCFLQQYLHCEADLPFSGYTCVCKDSLSGLGIHCCQFLRQAPETHQTQETQSHNAFMRNRSDDLSEYFLTALNCLELQTSKISTAGRSFRFLIHCTFIKNTVLFFNFFILDIVLLSETLLIDVLTVK